MIKKKRSNFKKKLTITFSFCRWVLKLYPSLILLIPLQVSIAAPLELEDTEGLDTSNPEIINLDNQAFDDHLLELADAGEGNIPALPEAENFIQPNMLILPRRIMARPLLPTQRIQPVLPPYIPMPPLRPIVYRDGIYLPGHSMGLHGDIGTNGQFSGEIRVSFSGSSPSVNHVFSAISGYGLHQMMHSRVGRYIVGIKSSWNSGGEYAVNFNVYQQLINQGNSREISAGNTPAGKYAIRVHGLTAIEIVEDYGLFIEVLFTYPEQAWISLGFEPPQLCKGNSQGFIFRDEHRRNRDGKPPLSLCI